MQTDNKKIKSIILTAIALLLNSGFVLALNNIAGFDSGEDFTSDLNESRALQKERASVTKELNPGQNCTVFYASDGKTALAGNNEDYTNPFMTISFLPAEEGKFGRIYFGHGALYPQGGMNEKGLFFDGATAEYVEVPCDSSKLTFEGSLILKAMEECSTVDEVLALFNRYDVSGSWNGQYLIGDRFGNSAIIEPLTFIKKNGNYQIITNFLQSKTKPEESNDTRYRLASELLEKSEDVSVDLFRRILSATHYEEYSGSMTATQYSFICDLKKKEIYVYYFHNFENEVVIDLEKELLKGKHSLDLPSLFPKTFIAESYLNNYKKRKAVHIAKVDPKIYDDYIGIYEMPHDLISNTAIAITRRGNKLYGFYPELPSHELLPTSKNHFLNISKSGVIKVTFKKDSSGKISEMRVESNKQMFTAKKIK